MGCSPTVVLLGGRRDCQKRCVVIISTDRQQVSDETQIIAEIQCHHRHQEDTYIPKGAREANHCNSPRILYAHVLLCSLITSRKGLISNTLNNSKGIYPLRCSRRGGTAKVEEYAPIVSEVSRRLRCIGRIGW